MSVKNWRVKQKPRAAHADTVSDLLVSTC